MKIIRRVIEKLFGLQAASDLFDRPDVIERTALECMKLMEMYDLDDGADVKHWIDKIIANLDYVKKFYGPQLIFALSTVSSFSELTNYLGENGVNYLEDTYETPENFIEVIRTRMLTEAKYGKPRYKKWFDANGVQVANKEFKIFMKFLALVITGQVHKEDCNDYWDKSMRSTVSRTSINLDKFIPFVRINHKRVIRAVLSGYSGIDFNTI